MHMLCKVNVTPVYPIEMAEDIITKTRLSCSQDSVLIPKTDWIS